MSADGSMRHLLSNAPPPGSGEPPWAYRCSICDMLVKPSETRRHLEEEKAKPTWAGSLHFTRVDLNG